MKLRLSLPCPGLLTATHCGAIALGLYVVVAAADGTTAEPAKFASHPPLRPLPMASRRPLADEPSLFVDAAKGDDTHDGSQQHPFKTIAHALGQLQPGDTLYLRGGTYYEQVRCELAASAEKPITIRGYPGELVTIDAGLRAFFNDPAGSWEPAPGTEMFRSTQRYPKLQRASGNFGDSLVPLHAYQSADDLRAANEFSVRIDGVQQPMYLGPGLWWNPDDERIYVRLSHTHVRAYAPGLYAGQTDPRKLPLVVTGLDHVPLHLEGARHVKIQDLVLRGGGENTCLVRNCAHVEFDNVTLYVGNRGMRVETTGHLRLRRCAFRGPMPPWGSRTASKYRTFDSHLFVPVGTYDITAAERKYLSPQCHDFEISGCQFTDGHDGVYVGGVARIDFHHNLVDNMNDDGVYLSAWGPPGTGLRIYQNRISRCLTTFAFGLGRGAESDPSDGVTICRNVIDLRGPVPYGHPGPDNPPELASHGRLVGDHGGPKWDPMRVYHNTFVVRSPQMSGYPSGWGGHLNDGPRRVFNNILIETDRLPTLDFPATSADFQADGNLLWSLSMGTTLNGDVFAAFRRSQSFNESKARYAPGWEAHSRFADPKLVRVTGDWRQAVDARLQRDSPAVNAGVELPADWFDPLKAEDDGPPDIGALPLGAERSSIGPAVSTDSRKRPEG